MLSDVVGGHGHVEGVATHDLVDVRARDLARVDEGVHTVNDDVGAAETKHCPENRSVSQRTVSKKGGPWSPVLVCWKMPPNWGAASASVADRASTADLLDKRMVGNWRIAPGEGCRGWRRETVDLEAAREVYYCRWVSRTSWQPKRTHPCQRVTLDSLICLHVQRCIRRQRPRRVPSYDLVPGFHPLPAPNCRARIRDATKSAETLDSEVIRRQKACGIWLAIYVDIGAICRSL